MPFTHLAQSAVLAVSPTPSLLASFYEYLTQSDPSFLSKSSRDHLSRRFRDVLLKLLTIVGGPQVLSVLIPLAKAEGDIASKSQSSQLDGKWYVNPYSQVFIVVRHLIAGFLIRHAEKMNVGAIYDRGLATINTIYGESLLNKIFDSWGIHKEDVKFNEIFALYGLYLSDFSVLTPLETEAVVYSSISCLGLGGPGNWHLRGMGRLLGARGSHDSSAEMKVILKQLMDLKKAVVSVVRFVGEEFVARAKLDKWADAASVSRDLGGWGDDD